MPALRPINTPLGISEVWQPPPLNYIKINVDSSSVDNVVATSVGVARNFAGHVLLTPWDYSGSCVLV